MAQRDATRRRVYVLGAILLLLTLALPMITTEHDHFDLGVYHGAVRYWLREDGMIYDWLLQPTEYGFTYPPFAAFVMAPIAVIPMKVASSLLNVASVLATVAVLWWLLAGLFHRKGWTLWYASALTLALVALFDPLTETLTFGQINLLLLGMVAGDVLLWQARGSRWAGVGVGLATSIKLTPGIFILYLLVTRQWRAAFTAMGTAAGVTLAAAAIAPDASREFWTSALWNTDRVGALAFVSNQSLQGVVARWAPGQPSRLAWAILVLATLVFWAWKANRAVRAGDHATGLALTGLVGCLVSPVTWIHHLVWMLPAITVMIVAGFDALPRTRERRLLFAVGWGTYVLMISRLPWAWRDREIGGVVTFIFSNTYVWAALALLLLLPIRTRLPAEPPGEPVEAREPAAAVA
jgi:alpha-1,2-mannosyltransferase